MDFVADGSFPDGIDSDIVVNLEQPILKFFEKKGYCCAFGIDSIYSDEPVCFVNISPDIYISDSDYKRLFSPLLTYFNKRNVTIFINIYLFPFCTYPAFFS